ncbi:MAG: glutamate--tRNA ligase [Oligoflexia bacterium]|nr:glutamate--tRNA ligase [Oligoflexia bacterium]
MSSSSNHSHPVRVRFAPSPTGFLHIGGVRTALFNWLYARHLGGQFLLRIEDTDLERSEERFTSDIIASMKWLGLNWDEEPIFQSKRLEEYRAKALELVARGLAYKCFCSEEEVEQMRVKATAEGKKPMYDRHCRDLGLERHPTEPNRPWVIRSKTPLAGYVEFTDLIRGPIRVENTEIDDFVLIRSNGAPTYNLSVVVDDVYSRMTHIIRGDDHINNTPKQIHLYRALGYEVPLFAHLPMILGPDKKKLSKRHGAVSANVYRSDGYLPEALLNFLARLGWSHGDQEIFTIQEMIQYFSFDHCQKSSAVFNVEKLLWLNGAHIRGADPKRLASIVAEDYSDHFAGIPQALSRLKTDLGARIVSMVQPKVKLIKELTEQVVPLCTPGAVEVDASGLKWNKDENLKAATQAAVQRVLDELSKKVAASGVKSGSDPVWGGTPSLEEVGMNHEGVDAYLRQVGEQHGVKLGDLVQPMRLVVTGRMVSASLFDLMAILPWDVVETRLRKIAAL